MLHLHNLLLFSHRLPMKQSAYGILSAGPQGGSVERESIRLLRKPNATLELFMSRVNKGTNFAPLLIFSKSRCLFSTDRDKLWLKKSDCASAVMLFKKIRGRP